MANILGQIMEHILGKRLLKCGAEILVAGLKHVPVVGAPIEFAHDCIQVADKMRDEQQLHDLEGRVRQLEEARACTPEEVRAIVQEVFEAYMAKGQAVPDDKKEAIHDIMQSMPGNVGQQINATISHAGKKSTSLFVALPIGNESGLEQEQRRFYLSLIPSRRPQYKSKMLVPNKPCWEFEDLLGMGGFGEVWKIKHKLLHQAQAIKLCLNKESGLILRQEAKTIAVLQEELSQHPNIVAVLDANVEDWPYWIAFEYISGGTLESYIRSFGGPLPLEEVSRLFVGICEGIKSAHEHNIVHRDIKPANILLTPTCQPKVADFGLGKIIIEETNKRESVQPSQQLHSMRGAGTFIYMSREQRNGLPADPRDDVFGLGVVLYQMLMGMPNQDPQYLRSDLRKLRTKPPAEIADILYDSLELPRGERIENASVMLDRFCTVCEKNNLPYISADRTVAVGFAGSDAAGAGISGSGVGSSAGIGISGAAGAGISSSGAGRVTSQIMIASQKELDDLQKKISGAKQALADLESQLLVKQKEYGTANERLEKVETLYKQKEKTIKQMQDALETAKQILEETQGTQSKVEKEITKAKQERQENESALSQTQTTLLHTKQELTQTQTALSSAKSELEGIKLLVEISKKELEENKNHSQSSSAQATSQAKTASQTASQASKSSSAGQASNSSSTSSPVIVSTSESYGLPEELWRECQYEYKGERYLDMTTKYWLKLGWQKQGEYAGIYQKAYADSKGIREEKIITLPKLPTSAQPLILRLIPPGRFWMGSPDSEEGHNIVWKYVSREDCIKRYGSDLSEGPRHKVTISQAYYLSVYECTQAQWQAVMGKNPSYFQNAGPDAPVEQVSWKDIAEGSSSFCSQTGLLLPSEAQWEYACRAGATGMSYVGDFEIKGLSNAPGLSGIAWYSGNSGVSYEGAYDSSSWFEKEQNHTRAGTHPVGQKTPNGFGLYDMLGNVWEWCGDNPRTYQNKDEHNPLGGNNLQSFVLRGGSWHFNARFVRCAYRGSHDAGISHNLLGFRVFSPVF